MTKGLLVNFEYCTGCHACEVSCRNEHSYPLDKWGIKLTEIGPFKTGVDSWEWDYVPITTSLCDLCAERVEQGKKPACVHHCLGQCMEYGTLEELVKRAEELGPKTMIIR